MKPLANAKRFCCAALDILFPRCCVVCGKRVDRDSCCMHICSVCCLNISWFSKEQSDAIFSLYKKKLNVAGVKGEFFANGYVCWEHSGVGRKIILSLKYKGHNILAKDIIKLIKRYAPYIIDYVKDSILVPVPISYLKHTKRDYNQTELIARELSKNADGVLIKKLLKCKNHASQTTLSIKERLLNTKEAFIYSDSNIDVNKRIVVLDDVITTGATLSTCCSKLFEHGFVNVNVLTLSHG